MKKSVVFMGILLILAMVGISGCTSSNDNRTSVANGTSSNVKETIIFDKNVGGTNVEDQYVSVPEGAKVRIELSNTTTSSNSSYLQILSLNVVGVNGNVLANYSNNTIDVKSFSPQDGFSDNITFASGIKSVGIRTAMTKLHIKIIAIN